MMEIAAEIYIGPMKSEQAIGDDADIYSNSMFDLD